LDLCFSFGRKFTLGNEWQSDFVSFVFLRGRIQDLKVLYIFLYEESFFLFFKGFKFFGAYNKGFCLRDPTFLIVE
jgi:hypothetical protein